MHYFCRCLLLCREPNTCKVRSLVSTFAEPHVHKSCGGLFDILHIQAVSGRVHRWSCSVVDPRDSRVEKFFKIECDHFKNSSNVHRGWVCLLVERRHVVFQGSVVAVAHWLAHWDWLRGVHVHLIFIERPGAQIKQRSTPRYHRLGRGWILDQ